MALYPLFVSSVQGAMHIDYGLPKEDAGLIVEKEKYHIFAIADGHGDRECMRSAKGSLMAVETAIQKLEEFANIIEENQFVGELLEIQKQENRIRQLIISIIAEWNRRILQDVEQNPFTEEELQQCVKMEKYYRNGQHLAHAYGTTLLTGLLTEDYLLLLQQGDGRCIIVDADGMTCEPVPWDDKCIDNLTASLCDDNAAYDCRYVILSMREHPPVACFLCSDGVEDSFAEIEQTYSFCRDLIRRACEDGSSVLQESLSEILVELNTNGSRDDTTISGFINVDEAVNFLEKFHQLDERLNLERAIRKIEDKLLSMSRKKEYLQNKLQESMERHKCLELVDTEEDVEIDIEAERKIEEECMQYLNRYDSFRQEKERLMAQLSQLEENSDE